MQQAGVCAQTLGGTGQDEQPGQVGADDRLQARAYYLDHHFFAGFEFGRVNLGHRGRGQRFNVETAEHLADFGAELFFDQLDRQLRVKRRHTVLQQHQLVGDIGRQQIAAR